jgi:uncharacterized membrane protein HdeD (DUF308 family)
MDTTNTLKYISMALLFVFGFLLIYQGLVYIGIRKDNPELPGKFYALGVVFIVVGVIDILVGILHIKL